MVVNSVVAIRDETLQPAEWEGEKKTCKPTTDNSTITTLLVGTLQITKITEPIFDIIAVSLRI